MNFSTETRIKATPKRVLEAITDLEGWQYWMPNLVAVEKITDGDFRCRHRMERDPQDVR